MKNILCIILTLTFTACGSNPNAKYEKPIADINSITKTSCAKGRSYIFKAADGVLTINYNTDGDVKKECTAKIEDLKFEYSTMEGDVDPGVDHIVIISCKSDDGKCFTGDAGSFGKIKIDIKGEVNAEGLVTNLTALQGQ